MLKAMLSGGKNRIGRRLIVQTIAFSTLITIVISTVQLFTEYRGLRNALDLELDGVKIYVPNIAASLWDFDEKQVQRALEALVLRPNIARVDIAATGTQAHLHAGTQPSANVVQREFSLSHEADGSATEIGTLTVVAHLDGIYRQIAASALYIVAGNGLKTLLVALFMVYLVRRLVTSRLEDLSRKVHELVPRVVPLRQAAGLMPLTIPASLDELDAVDWVLDKTAGDIETAVSSLAKINDELFSSQQTLHTVLDTIPQRIFWKDRNSILLGCNKSFAADADCVDPDALIGKPVSYLNSTEADEHIHEIGRQVMVSGEAALNCEASGIMSDGSQGWLTISKVPLRDKDGKVVAVLGTYEDITERKRAEQELLAHRNHLEELVATRTVELERARQDAERASQAKTDFLARMSHELRTPMNAILGFSQVLESEPLSAEQSDYVREIHGAGDHLLELINDLLDLSRIESGQFTTVIQTVALISVIEQAQQLVKPLLQQKNVTLVNNCPSSSVLADPTRLKQVLVNLLSNAIKYNHVGGSVQLHCDPVDAERVRIAVVDTGPGIAPEKLKLLFRPFERLGAEFSAIEGAGIGLALSKRLAELMGGALGVESTIGEGSTFWLDLPQAQNAPQPAAITAVPLPDGDSSKFRVLYVEDNAANLRVVEAMLRHQPDMSLISATSGVRGLERARSCLPDVIVLDIHLPGMDGYAVLEALRLDAKTRHIRVIALSADAMPVDIERGLKAGFSAYLTKPVKREELIAALTSR